MPADPTGSRRPSRSGTVTVPATDGSRFEPHRRCETDVSTALSTTWTNEGDTRSRGGRTKETSGREGMIPRHSMSWIIFTYMGSFSTTPMHIYIYMTYMECLGDGRSHEITIRPRGLDLDDTNFRDTVRSCTIRSSTHTTRIGPKANLFL